MEHSPNEYNANHDRKITQYLDIFFNDCARRATPADRYIAFEKLLHSELRLNDDEIGQFMQPISQNIFPTMAEYTKDPTQALNKFITLPLEYIGPALEIFSDYTLDDMQLWYERAIATVLHLTKGEHTINHCVRSNNQVCHDNHSCPIVRMRQLIVTYATNFNFNSATKLASAYHPAQVTAMQLRAAANQSLIPLEAAEGIIMLSQRAYARFHNEDSNEPD